VLVEAIPRLAQRLKETRPDDIVANYAITASFEKTVTFYVHEKDELSSVSVHHIDKFSEFGGSARIVETFTCPNVHIDEFTKTLKGAHIDFMSVDIEGADAEVLAAMDPTFQPSIIQCEVNGDVRVFTRILGPRGYGLVAETDVNAIFLRSELV
jgi:FkbM family methyltransferase